MAQFMRKTNQSLLSFSKFLGSCCRVGSSMATATRLPPVPPIPTTQQQLIMKRHQQSSMSTKIDYSLYIKEWCFPNQEEEESSTENETDPLVVINRYPGFPKPDPTYSDNVFYSGTLEKGARCDLDALLLTDTRKYLIHCQSGQKIDARSWLENKFVLIVGFFIPILKDDAVAVRCRNLIETYAEFRKQNIHDFEVVMAVMLRKDLQYDPKVAEDAANDFLRGFPWLTVPFSDVASCTRIFEAVGIRCYYYPPCVLLSKDRKVLQLDHKDELNNFLHVYGTDSYPFTDEKLNEIKKSDCVKLWNEYLPKLETLLDCSPDLELRRFNGDKVSVAYLSKTTTVGLYLCATGYAMQELKDVYQQCKALGYNFEVVVVCQPFCEWRDWQSSHQKRIIEFQNMILANWVIFPFNEKVCRRLWRICDGMNFDKMIVVGCGGSEFDYWALEVLRAFGAPAFPFTRDSAIEATIRRLSGVTLKSLFGEQKLYRWSKSSNRVSESVSNLEGRNVIVCFAYLPEDESEEEDRLYEKMLKWYDIIKDNHHDFEVVFVCSGLSEGVSFDERCQTMPWVIVEYDEDFTKSFMKKARVFDDDWACTLIAIGNNGGIHSLAAQCYDLPNAYDYIFSSGDLLRDEVIMKIQCKHIYDLYD